MDEQLAKMITDSLLATIEVLLDYNDKDSAVNDLLTNPDIKKKLDKIIIDTHAKWMDSND